MGRRTVGAMGIVLAMTALPLGATASAQTVAGPFTPLCGQITEDTTWSAAGNPCVQTCPVGVGKGVTLTITSGAAVKLSWDGLGLAGRLVARACSLHVGVRR
jgi:hypothetical protein